MPGPAELPISFAERRLLRWLFLLYCLFILYGSFIPFRFSDDPEFVRSQFARFFTPPYDHGIRRFSLPDVVSNILLFLPFGFLWVGGEFSLRMQSRFWRVAFTGGVLGLLSRSNNRIRSNVFSGPNCVDPGRLMQWIRSATGAAAGFLLFRAFRGVGLSPVAALQQRPSLFSWPCSCSHRLPMLTIPLTLLWTSPLSGTISKISD